MANGGQVWNSLVESAAEFARKCGRPFRGVTVAISNGNGKNQVAIVEEGLFEEPETVVELKMSQPPLEAPAHWKWFSDLEQQVVDVLTRIYSQNPGQGRTRMQLAEELGENPEGQLKNVLANLVNRDILRSGKNGYTLNMGTQAHPPPSPRRLDYHEVGHRL